MTWSKSIFNWIVNNNNGNDIIGQTSKDQIENLTDAAQIKSKQFNQSIKHWTTIDLKVKKQPTATTINNKQRRKWRWNDH